MRHGQVGTPIPGVLQVDLWNCASQCLRYDDPFKLKISMKQSTHNVRIPIYNQPILSFSWWLQQPIKKIYSSNWIILPRNNPTKLPKPPRKEYVGFPFHPVKNIVFFHPQEMVPNPMPRVLALQHVPRQPRQGSMWEPIVMATWMSRTGS